MTRKCGRGNGEGSIFPYRNGYAAYAWVTTPDGYRRRKWVYGKTRDEVAGKWHDAKTRARQGPVPPSFESRLEPQRVAHTFIVKELPQRTEVAIPSAILK